MYSPLVIARNEALLAEQLGIRLVRHSIEEVDQANAFFNTIHDGKGGFTRDLTALEKEWVDNERTLCKIDFLYWATRYHWIKSVNDRIIKFAPNKPQSIILDVLGELQERGQAQFLQSGKARQEGVTTLSEALVEHRCLFYPNTGAIVGSSDPKKSAEMVGKFFLSWELQPFWLRPKQGHYSTGEWYEFSNGVTLWVQHGAQKTAIGRGTTPSVCHLSECADFDDGKGLIEAGLLKSLHETPNALFIAESTANGDEGWWHDFYQDNKQHFESGGAKMMAHFLPWYVRRDIYPTETWLNKSAVPEDYKPNKLTKKHADRAYEYVKNSRHLQKYLGEGWTMPIEQQWFYEVEYERHRRSKSLHIWFQEMPADDIEMFQSPTTSIFETELISDLRNAAAPPVAVFAIRGDGIDRKYWPRNSDINTDLPILRVRANWEQSLPPFTYEFVPLKLSGYPDVVPQNKLFIWEFPENDSVYGFSGDTSDGLGVDRSDNFVLQVMRKGTSSKNDAQVAEFASAEISGARAWPWALAVGTLYSVLVNGKLTQPKFVPEINREGGRILMEEMGKRGWRKKTHRQVRRSSLRRGTPTITYGWYMTEPTRADMLDWLKEALENDYIEINSPWFISEMNVFIKNEQGRFEAKKGKKDDRIIALGILYDSLYRNETRNHERTPIIERTIVVPPDVRYPLYNAGAQITEQLASATSRMMQEEEPWI